FDRLDLHQPGKGEFPHALLLDMTVDDVGESVDHRVDLLAVEGGGLDQFVDDLGLGVLLGDCGGLLGRCLGGGLGCCCLGGCRFGSGGFLGGGLGGGSFLGRGFSCWFFCGCFCACHRCFPFC